MKNLLVINSSADLEHSHSRELTRFFIEKYQTKFSQTKVCMRDVAVNPIPPIMPDTLNAIRTNTPIESAAGKDARALSEELISELNNADIIVFGVPMYNFTIPSTLKAYFDYIIRKDLTFSYDPQVNRIKGSLTGKQVVVITTGGGLYQDTPMDFQAPYIKAIFGFIGLDENLTFIRAHGLLYPNNEVSLEAAKQSVQNHISELANEKISLAKSTLSNGIFNQENNKEDIEKATSINLSKNH